MSFASEIAAIHERAVFFHAPRFEWVEGVGKDCLSFLHRVTTGDVAGLAAGAGAPTLLLDPKSRVQFVSCVFVGGEKSFLVIPKGQGTAFAAGLSKFAIMDDCTFAPVGDRGVLSVLGPAAADGLKTVGIPEATAVLSDPALSHRWVAHAEFGDIWIGHVPELGADGLWVGAPEESLAALSNRLRAAGVPALSPDSAEILRIQALEPRTGAEISPDRFPVEIGLGRAICHSKGCYVGQETIVRMRDRGNCRRRLVKLELAGAEAPTVGDILDAPKRPTAGQVTSASAVPEGKAVALALLSTTLLVGTTVQIHHHDRLLDANVVAESKPFE